MKAKLIDLFEYNSHYNIDLINAIEPHLNHFPKKVEEIMNHILNSHIFWNNRIIGEPDIDRWQVRPYQDLIQINQDNHELTKKIILERDLSDTIAFKNSKGGISESNIEDIYFHLANHGTYHRGQLALLFRQSDVEPLRTDYILYKITR